MSQEIALTTQFAAALGLAADIKTLAVVDSASHALMDATRRRARSLLDELDAAYKADRRYTAFQDLQAQKIALEKALKEANAEGKAKQLAYEAAEEAKRQAAEAALAAELAKDTPSEVVAPMVIVPKTTPTTRSQVRWDFKIENANAIPRQFLTPDLTAIRRVVIALKGACNIPGISVHSRKV